MKWHIPKDLPILSPLGTHTVNCHESELQARVTPVAPGPCRCSLITAFVGMTCVPGMDVCLPGLCHGPSASRSTKRAAVQQASVRRAALLARVSSTSQQKLPTFSEEGGGPQPPHLDTTVHNPSEVTGPSGLSTCTDTDRLPMSVEHLWCVPPRPRVLSLIRRG